MSLPDPRSMTSLHNYRNFNHFFYCIILRLAIMRKIEFIFFQFHEKISALIEWKEILISYYSLHISENFAFDCA